MYVDVSRREEIAAGPLNVHARYDVQNDRVTVDAHLGPAYLSFSPAEARRVSDALAAAAEEGDEIEQRRAQVASAQTVPS